MSAQSDNISAAKQLLDDAVDEMGKLMRVLLSWKQRGYSTAPRYIKLVTTGDLARQIKDDERKKWNCSVYQCRKRYGDVATNAAMQLIKAERCN